MQSEPELRLRCRCGATELVASGRPIVGVICGCSHCAEAQSAFEAMGAPPSSEGEGRVAAILYRNDRVRLLSGQHNLRQYRLAPDSPTRRIVADCCKTPMFLDFENGFWLSLYRDRTQVSEAVVKRASSNLGFAVRLLQTFVSIGFRRPKLDPKLEGLEEHPLRSPSLAGDP